MYYITPKLSSFKQTHLSSSSICGSGFVGTGYLHTLLRDFPQTAIEALASARVSSEDPTWEGSIPELIFMITGRIQVLDAYSYLCGFLQRGNLLHQSRQQRESPSKMEVIIPYNIISEVTLLQHCHVLLDRNKLLKVRV